MTEEIVKYEIPDTQTMETVLVSGDLSKLSPSQRMRYYEAVCRSIGVNPLTKPFDYIAFQGRLQLYANKDCAAQLRQNRGVSVTKLERERMDELIVVTAYGENAEGRKDSSIGAVPVGNLRGDALANAMMKAETKAKRRLTLSLCGLGFLDEAETETIPGARRVDVTDDGEIVDQESEHKEQHAQPNNSVPLEEVQWRKLVERHPIRQLYESAMALGAPEDEIAQHLSDARGNAKLALANIEKLYVK